MRAAEHKGGSCCACGQHIGSVNNIVCLDFEAPPGFLGWGCLQCGQPSRGALAVLCDACLKQNAEPKFIAGGAYLVEHVRVPLDGYERKPFGHVFARHPEMQLQ